MKYIIIFIALLGKLYSQFYNGPEKNFGKNRVNNFPRTWQYVQYPWYSIFYYDEAKNLTPLLKNIIEVTSQDILNFLGIEISAKEHIFFILYASSEDMFESNVLHPEELSISAGKLLYERNKVVLGYPGDPVKFYKEVKKALIEIFLERAIYGTEWKDRIKNFAIINIPDWMYKGLIRYLANEEDPEAILWAWSHHNKKRFTRPLSINIEEAEMVGYTMFKYIAFTFGKSVIKDILEAISSTKNAEDAISSVLGRSIDEILTETQKWITEKYKFPLMKKTIKLPTYGKVKYLGASLNGSLLLLSITKNNSKKVYLVNISTGKKRVIYKEQSRNWTRGYSNYPLASFINDSTIFIITAENYQHYVIRYNLMSRNYYKRPLHGVKNITSLNYNYLTNDFFLCADGYVFKYSLISGTLEKVNDINIYPVVFAYPYQKGWFILSPSQNYDKYEITYYSNNLKKKIFQGNIYEIPNFFDYFEYKKEEHSPIPPRSFLGHSKSAKDTNYFLIFCFNNYQTSQQECFRLSFDSSIIHIDTAIHWKYDINISPYLNFPHYALNIIPFGGKHISIVPLKKRIGVGEIEAFSLPMTSRDNENLSTKTEETPRHSEIQDTGRVKVKYISIEKLPFNLLSFISERKPIDTKNYIFESEKNLKKKKSETEPPPENTSYSFIDTSSRRTYQGSFISSEITTFLDLDGITNFYQPFIVTVPYIQFPYIPPGIGATTTLKIYDIPEDYAISMGIRYSITSSFNELFLAVANRSNRMDKKYRFSRSVYSYVFPEPYQMILKIQTNKLDAELSYPFSEFAKILFVPSIFQQIFVVKATDYFNLKYNPLVKIYWAYFAGCFVYDNSHILVPGHLKGIRTKFFVDLFKPFKGMEPFKLSEDEKKFYRTIAGNLGMDARVYIPIITSNMTLMGRLAFASSIIKQSTIYYLGGLSNWIPFGNYPIFNFSNPVSPKEYYLWHTIATPVRGFIQNSRHGTGFALYNMELWISPFRMLPPKAIINEFFQNFKITFFLDFGITWLEKIKNLWEKQYYISKEIYSGPIYITIKNYNTPYIGGIGFGIRSKLLGYFIKVDTGWGIENETIYKKPRIYVSFGSEL